MSGNDGRMYLLFYETEFASSLLTISGALDPEYLDRGSHGSGTFVQYPR